MAYFYRLIFFVLVVASGASNAAFDTPRTWRYSYSAGGYVSPETYSSPDTACRIGIAAAGNGSYTFAGSEQNVPNTYDCKATWTFNGGGSGYMGSLYPETACPTGSTASAPGKCSCDANHNESGQACYPKNDPDTICGNDFRYAGWHTGAAGGEIQVRQGRLEHGSQFCAPFPAAGGGGGCTVQWSLTGMYQNDDNTWASYGFMTPVDKTSGGLVKGQNCAADEQGDPKGDGEKPKPPDEPPCKDGYEGEVQGVKTCVPNTNKNGVDLGKIESTKKDSDGTETKTSTEVSCKGGVCTTTTTTTTTKNGQTSSKTETNEQKESEFCASNPTKCANGSVAGGLAGPKGNGKGGSGDDDDKGEFGGNCMAGFVCKGDPLQCAVAKEQHKRNCEMYDDKNNDFYRLFEKEAFKEGNALDGLEGNETHDFSRIIDVTDRFLGSASCPPDRVIDFGRAKLEIPYSKLCPWFSILGNILVIIAAFACARILIKRG